MGDRILLVEDDHAIMDTLTIVLSYEGYEVLKARSVVDALALLKDEEPKLVLLDYMLVDGTAEPVVVAARKCASNPIVILLTAAAAPQEKCMTIGADSVVAKPFELDVLLQAVRQSFGQGRAPTACNNVGFVFPKKVFAAEAPRFA